MNSQDVNISKNDTSKYNTLTPFEEFVILKKGTERAYTGKYYDFKGDGIYICKRCDAPLYNSSDKFDSHCGWPSFDDEIPGAVKRVVDADGERTEILCANCGGHLGHVFLGERFTDKNTRHCVNSVSISFISKDSLETLKKISQTNTTTDTAIFAGGCFWGVEHFFNKKDGVISTTVGYIGGKTNDPSYEDVCSHSTGHAEAIEIVFDTNKVSYEELAKLFFEIHDPTQINRQGPDVGDQYRSEIFFKNEDQKKISEKLISILKGKGFNVATKLTKATKFWPAESYHQDYYLKKQGKPYCHAYQKKF